MNRTKGAQLLLLCLMIQPGICGQQRASQESTEDHLRRGTELADSRNWRGAQQTPASEKNQAVALPAAKEDLIGELSDEPKEVADVVLGSDGLRFAAKIKRGKQWILVVDGKEQRAFDDISGISFSLPAARHVIYATKRNGKWTEMLDDKELGPAFDALVP